MPKFNVGDNVKLRKYNEFGFIEEVEYGVYIREFVYIVHIVKPYNYRTTCTSDEIKLVTGNYAIDHVVDETKSIEQQINDIYSQGNVDDYSDYGYPEFKQGNDVIKIEIIDNNETFKIELNEPYLTSDWKEALHNAYIDMALDTEDWDWLKELVGGVDDEIL